MTEETDYTWLQHDINILRQVLRARHYSDSYSEIFIKKLLDTFENSSLSEITIPLVRNTFIYDTGRAEADRIADHFNQLRTKGSYENEVQRWARERGYDKD